MDVGLVKPAPLEIRIVFRIKGVGLSSMISGLDGSIFSSIIIAHIHFSFIILDSSAKRLSNLSIKYSMAFALI